MPVLTVMISSYNRPAGLGRAVASVLDSAVQKEIIIVDDASTNEETLALLLQYEEYPAIRVIRGPARTPVEKRDNVLTACVLINEALRSSDSRFVAYLTDGAYYLDGHLDGAAKVLAQNDKLDVAWDLQWYRILGDDGKATKSRLSCPVPLDHDRHPRFHFPATTMLARLKSMNFLDHSSVVERRNDIPWSEHPGDWQDFDWKRWKEMAAAGKSFQFVPHVGSVKSSGPWSIGIVTVRGGNVADAALHRK